MDNSESQPLEKLALVNGQIIFPDRVVEGKAIIVSSGRIAGITKESELAAGIERVDVGGRYITPGLIDIHTHGAKGHSFSEATADAFRTITEENVSRGVTALLATTSTAPIPELVAALNFTREWQQDQHDGSQVLGVHVEGPYFSLEQRGAQDPQNIRTPDDGTPDLLLEHADVITMMTYAPELPGALELTTRLVQLGIVPAAGHSSAKDEEVATAAEYGLRHIIHIWSGQSSTIREGPWRKPGILEAALVYDQFTVEMIADNRHLPPTLMKLAYKCIGPDRLCIISDATNGAGLPDGTRFGMGHMTYEVHDGVGMLLDRTSFAGSTTLLNEMVAIMRDIVGVPLVEAVRMATLNPARVIGVADRKGSLTVGKDADIAIFDEDFSAWRTMIAGRWVSAS